MLSYDDVLDIMTRRQVFLQRLAADQSQQIAYRINRNAGEVFALLSDNLDEALSIGAFTQKQTAVLNGLEKELQAALGVNYAAAQEWYVKELEELVGDEVAAARRVLGAASEEEAVNAIAQPPQTALNRITATVPYNGYTISEWFSGTQSEEINRIMARVRVGIANGETLGDIVRGIRGTRESGFTDGIMKGYTTKRAEMLARTITNGVANKAREDFYAANSDLIAYEVYTATLDGRTSMVCRTLDGEKFDQGEGPIPPLHPNCRSTRVPVTNLMADQGLIGKRGYSRETKPRNEMQKEFRAEAKKKAGEEQWKEWSVKQRNAAISRERRAWQDKNIGQTWAKTSYSEWFKRQPAWFQKEVLGSSRYALYQKGGLALDKFVDHNYQSYTLAQLREVNKAAFKRAGI